MPIISWAVVYVYLDPRLKLVYLGRDDSANINCFRKDIAYIHAIGDQIQQQCGFVFFFGEEQCGKFAPIRQAQSAH